MIKTKPSENCTLCSCSLKCSVFVVTVVPRIGIAGTVKGIFSRSSDYPNVAFSAFTGCYVSGLFLEGADWDTEQGCLIQSKPRVPVVELPILKIIPTEAHRLRLQVWLFTFLLLSQLPGPAFSAQQLDFIITTPI